MVEGVSARVASPSACFTGGPKERVKVPGTCEVLGTWLSPPLAPFVRRGENGPSSLRSGGERGGQVGSKQDDGSAHLEGLGYTVIRFSSEWIPQDSIAVLDKIAPVLGEQVPGVGLASAQPDAAGLRNTCSCGGRLGVL